MRKCKMLEPISSSIIWVKAFMYWNIAIGWLVAVRMKPDWLPCSVPMRRNMLLTLREELLLLNRPDRFTCYRMFIGYKKQNENLCISLKSFTFVQLI